MTNKEQILIIGAGLCGSLLALRLAQRGYKVQLMEKRPDLRTTDVNSGRSINLAFSDRGLKGIKLVGLQEKVLSICIPMHGRMIHDKRGDTFSSDYSGRKQEYINSISRGDLNALLLTEAENHNQVDIQFNKKCTGVDIDNLKAHFYCHKTKQNITLNPDVIIGTDGAGSVLRKSYVFEENFLFSHSQNFLKHGYKELEIPALGNGSHRIFKNALHIWPRGDYMLIALPNMDGSFTVTLFLSYEEGTYNFNNLTSPESVEKFFKSQFPDALKIIPNIADEFFNNPTGILGTVKCSPWHYKGKTLLMGDAAHAIVPFYGQGMNASFEDVVVFDSILEEYEGNWETIFKTYESTRKKDTDAIADLAIDNYHEMRDHVMSPLFIQKRKIELELEKAFPETYFSKYALVTFNERITYSEAMKRGRAQDRAILNLISERKLLDDMSLKEKLVLILHATNEILHEDSIAKNL